MTGLLLLIERVTKELGDNIMSQMSEYNSAVTWNPWHGCKKVSEGCANCYVYAQDKRYGRDTTVVTKGATTYKLKAPIGSTVMLCFSSDFFIPDADIWRDGCWDEIRYRTDCKFIIPTKRPERIKECVPDDWGDGWDNVLVIASVENQKMADKRLADLCDAPLKHRGVFCAPLIAPVSLAKWLDTGMIDEVSVGGDNASSYLARPLSYQWVFNIYRECIERDVAFWFHQTGTIFIKDGLDYGESRHGKMIEVANEFAEVLANDYNVLKSRIDSAFTYTKDRMNYLLWQSSVIEGKPVGLLNIDGILSGVKPDNVDIRDAAFISNLKTAWDFMLLTVSEKITVKYISQLNKICGDNGLIYGSGTLRVIETTITGTSYVPDIPEYDVVANGLDVLSAIEEPIARAIALFCFIARGQFFVDGNKRVAQLILNKVLISEGIGIVMFNNYDDIDELKRLLIEYYETANPTRMFTFIKKYIRRV